MAKLSNQEKRKLALEIQTLEQNLKSQRKQEIREDIKLGLYTILVISSVMIAITRLPF